MSLFLNGRPYSCLVCPKSSPSCSEQQHPLQRLISYDELISKYARKVNSDQYDAIGIYTCPYCALDRLTVDSLYAHSRDVHPPAGCNDVPSLPAVHCPVCVCFRLENSPAFIQQHAGGLSEHMLNRHCFASTHQYRDELKLRSEFCCEDEFELIRFTATFLPPAIIISEVLSGHPDDNQDGLQSHEYCLIPPLFVTFIKLRFFCSKISSKHVPPVCPICLEQMEPDACKNLQLCGHQFHPLCIDRWLEEKKCCPVCRCECS
uniref:RING-type domain-containing protein n=1 Tax=Anopheles minimus TaxID=112268 RepID=A0A182VWH3_9DIPT